MGGGVAFLVNEVLFLLLASKGSCFDDLFDFPFKSIISDVRWGLEIV